MRAARLACLAAIALLLATIVLPLTSAEAAPASPERARYKHREEHGWLVIETDVIGLALHKHRPFFAWWYVKDNETIYIVHYKGLIEYLMWPIVSLVKPYSWAEEVFEGLMEDMHDYYGFVREVGSLVREIHAEVMMLHVPVSEEEIDELMNKTSELAEAVEELLEWATNIGAEELAEHLEAMNATLTEMMALLEELRENRQDYAALRELKNRAHELRREWHMAMHDLFSRWCEWVRERMHEMKEFTRRARKVKLLHPPLFSFAEGNWTLTGPENITAPNGTVIGLWFAYELAEVYNPTFEFAEGNITIRCRMYFVPVIERAGEINYTVTRAELKQDIVILGWRWNIDLLRELAEEVGLPFAENLTSGLALRLELLAVNATHARLGELLEGLEEPLELRDLVASVAEEAEQIDELVSEACEELDEKAEEALEELEEWELELDEVRGLLQEMVFMVEEALAGLDVHEELLSGLKEKATELGAEVLASCIESLEALVEQAKAFFTSINATLYEAMGSDDPAVVASALTTIRTEIQAFLPTFKAQVGAVLQALDHEAVRMRECLSSKSMLKKVKMGGEEIDVEDDETFLRERPFERGVDLKDMFEVRFLSENATLAGWFKFVNASLVYYPNGTVAVMPVRLAYMRAGRTLHLFMIYGYFNGGSLEHDPSVGLDVPEAGGEPSYEVEVPSGSETEPSVQPITIWPGGPVTYLLTPEHIAFIALGLVAITAIVLVARRRKKTINLY